MFCIVLAYSYLCIMKQLLSIFVLLVALCCCTTEADRNRMRSGLDSINERNRNDQPFTVKDVEPYVQFFDDHGTPNDRLLAHYLLGRAYYEAGEAPMALECYQKALDCADTTAKGFDFCTLSSAYSQMATLYRSQLLLINEIEARKKASHYAFRANQLQWALYDKAMSVGAYILLNKKDSAEIILKSVLQQYRKNGYTQQALRYSKPLMYLYTQDSQRLVEAKALMDQFEAESDLFDEHHELPSSQRQYYDYKGRYFEGIHQLDSAEYYYRKIYRSGMSYVDQDPMYRGLLSVFSKRHQADSISKYAQLYCTANDSSIALKDRDQIARMTALYNYNRLQKEAQVEREKATQRTIIIWICLAVIVLICVITYIIIRELSHKRYEAEQKYIHSLELIEQARHDIDKLRNSEETNKELISEKEHTIHDQEIILKSLLHKDVNSHSLADKKLKGTDIYMRFERLSTLGQIPTEEEWNLLQSQISTYYPGFHDFMQEHDFHLSDKERKICLLLRIGFKPTNIANMIGVTFSYITELRTKMLQKLFGLSGNSKSFDKMLREIY